MLPYQNPSTLIHKFVITGRNEVVAKLIFLHPSVIHSVHGGGGLPQCMLGYHPPGSRHPPKQTHTPQEQTPPPRKQTPAYGLRAAGTHPTGMHSCLLFIYYCGIFEAVRYDV